jgi:hypothetical protein
VSIEFEEHPSVDEAYDEPRRLGGTDVLRGAMVVGTAVAVGAVLLISGIGGDDESALTSAVADSTVAESTDGNADDSAADSAGSGALDDGTLFDPIGDPITGASGTDDQPDTFGQPATGVESDMAADELPSGLTEGTGAGEVLPSEDTSAGVTGAAATSESAVRLPAEVKVLVLNGIGTQGTAARGTAPVEAAGYVTGTPKNAEPTPQLSGIYYAEGYQREALDVALVYSSGLDSLVKPLTADNAPVADTQSANVIVVIGSDQAIPLP